MSAENNLAEAAKLLRDAEIRRIEECSTAVEKILAEYGCTMLPQVTIRGGQIIPQIVVILEKDSKPIRRLNKGIDQRDT